MQSKLLELKKLLVIEKLKYLKNFIIIETMNVYLAKLQDDYPTNHGELEGGVVITYYPRKGTAKIEDRGAGRFKPTSILELEIAAKAVRPPEEF